MVRKLNEDTYIEDIGNYRFAIIIKNDSGKSYNFVEWADSLRDGKSTAREYYDSDFNHRTHSEYWVYDTKKHKAYLPQGFSSTDQKFNDSLPIYKEDDEGRWELLVDYVNDKVYGMKESAMLVGWDKVEDICDNFRFTGDWFKDLHKLWDRLDRYYYNEVEVYNENIAKRIKDKVTEVIVSKYPEFEEEIQEEIW